MAEKESKKAIDRLTILGTIFLPPSLMVSLLSIGVFDFEKSYSSLAIGIVAVFLSAFLGYHYVKNEIFYKDKKSKKGNG
jgi:Mg2+ and Co2+ transporter CorA